MNDMQEAKQQEMDLRIATDESGMNIHEKLQNIKVELATMDLTKTGHNKHSNYKYFQLSDFMPKVNELLLKYKLNTYCTFSKDEAKLEIHNIENLSEYVIITSPMVDGKVPGGSAIQSLGAVETYQRRYLYMAALDICEDDYADSTETQQYKVDNSNVKRLKGELKLFPNPEQAEAKLLKKYEIKTLKDLDILQWSEIMTDINDWKKAQKNESNK